MMENLQWTIGRVLQWGESHLKNYSPTPRLDIELLLAHALGVRRLELYLDYYRPLAKNELKTLRGFVLRRLQQEPIAYITGIKEFWSLEFRVNKSTLIPRPETELLVETAVHLLKKDGQKNGASGKVVTGKRQIRILDLGTGCGNLPIALSKEFPSSTIVSIDICQDALRIAKENVWALAREKRIYFIRGDFFQSLRSDDLCSHFQLVVSNPPYVPADELTSLPPSVKDYEPRKALDGGLAGLDYISLIIQKAHLFLNPQGYLVMEIGLNQAEKVKRLVDDVKLWKDVKFLKDYQGIERILYMAKQG